MPEAGGQPSGTINATTNEEYTDTEDKLASAGSGAVMKEKL